MMSMVSMLTGMTTIRIGSGGNGDDGDDGGGGGGDGMHRADANMRLHSLRSFATRFESILLSIEYHCLVWTMASTTATTTLTESSVPANILRDQ